MNVLTVSNINDTCRDEVTQVINNDNNEIIDNGKHQEVYDQTTEDTCNEVPAKTNVQTTSDIIAITNVHEAKQNEYSTEINSVNIDPLIINALENIGQKTNDTIEESIRKLDGLIVEDAPMITGNTNYITVLQDEMIGKTLQTTVPVNINEALPTKTNTTSFFPYQNKNVFILKQKDKQNIEQPLLLKITEKILNHEDARANVLNSKDLEQNVILHYNGIVNKDNTKRIAIIWSNHHFTKKRKAKGEMNKNLGHKKIIFMTKVRKSKNDVLNKKSHKEPHIRKDNHTNVNNKDVNTHKSNVSPVGNVEKNVAGYPSQTSEDEYTREIPIKDPHIPNDNRTTVNNKDFNTHKSNISPVRNVETNVARYPSQTIEDEYTREIPIIF